MSDSLRPLQDLPTATKWLAAVLVALLSVISSVGTVAAWHSSLASKSYVATVIAAHNHLPRTTAHEGSPHPELSRAIAVLERATMAAEEARAASAARDVALFRRLVSLEAADLEPDRRRAAGAAAHARAAYDDAIARGMAPDVAAQRAIDDRPPWRR